MPNALPARTIAAVNVLSALARRVLPHDCFICGLPADDALLCAPCLEDLPALTPERCPVCALPTPQGAVCGACVKAPPHFDATLAVFEYRAPIEPLVVALKYHARLPVAAFLARMAAQVLERPKATCIVAMPLHTRRLAERGFNQSVEIARRLGREWKLPVRLDACVRSRDTTPQVELSWKLRRGNVKGAFLGTEDLTGLQVLVVDDVMTTGATLDELARALKSRGAATVTNCVIARALPALGVPLDV